MFDEISRKFYGSLEWTEFPESFYDVFFTNTSLV